MLPLKFKWEDTVWIHLTEAFTSFSWPGLPDDVHFTLSYHPDNETMNLHLTRNVGRDGINKPQMRIAEWPKEQFEEMAKFIVSRYFQKAWVPFDMRKYQSRSSALGRRTRYCSMSRMIQREGLLICSDAFGAIGKITRA